MAGFSVPFSGSAIPVDPASSEVGSRQPADHIGTSTVPGTSPGSNAASPPQESCEDDATGCGRLLKALWPSSDLWHQLGTLDRQTHIFRNITVGGACEAVDLARSISDGGTDAYFGCAEYSTPTGRTSSNAASAIAFWLDLDCGDAKAANGKGYLTSGDAIAAVERFCVDCGLPPPNFLVNSGSGIHVYWVLDKSVPRETWQQSAKGLKKLTHTFGLLADNCRTADIASVLRLPGTRNFKYDPPKQVSLIHATADRIGRSTMLNAIEKACLQHCPAATNPPLRMVPPCKASPPSESHLRLLQAILDCLDADCECNDWFRVGAACFNETGASDKGFELFDAWSRKGSKYDGIITPRQVWKTLRLDHDKPIKIASLRRMVEARGYDWLSVCDSAQEQFGYIVVDTVEDK